MAPKAKLVPVSEMLDIMDKHEEKPANDMAKAIRGMDLESQLKYVENMLGWCVSIQPCIMKELGYAD